MRSIALSILVLSLVACDETDDKDTTDTAAPTDDTATPTDDTAAPTDTGADTDTTVPAVLEIAGTYTDGFSTHTLDDTSWTVDAGAYGISTYAVLDFDNDGDWLVARNGNKNGYNPGLYSRFEWTTFNDQLYYCQVLFDGADEDAARSAGPADAAAPDKGGCGPFPWSALTAQ